MGLREWIKIIWVWAARSKSEERPHEGNHAAQPGRIFLPKGVK
jgi:hypothetical protein